MPRSRSRSIESSTCASISRFWSAPVISRKRSASVDLPWSMCAMTEKLRMRCGSTADDFYCDPGTAACDGSPGVERLIPLRILRADVLGPRPDQPIVRVLLEHVRRPARDAADGEDRREQIDVDPEGVIRRRRVEVDVRVQVLLALHQRLDALRHVEPDGLPGALAEIARHL